MYQALYRKWRPQTFDDVYGQEHITSILKYETQNDRFSHAYLFCGSRGTGKTTCAKILAKAVNCESPVNGSPCNKCASCRAIDSEMTTDVLEMDAASNNGVDNIRDIRDEVVYLPTMLKYKVYIVDEVHMLSGSAFNALLKTLEEPPSHVIFILATTELHKLPATIISRCQRFDFRRIYTSILVERLELIAKSEGIEYETDALRAIAKMANGGMRDAISLLELCAGTRNAVTVSLVNETLGSGSRQELENTVKAIAVGNYDAIFSTVQSVVSSSRDISVFWQDLLAYYRDMLVVKTTGNAEAYLDVSDSELAHLKTNAELFTKESMVRHCKILDEAFYTMQKSVGSKRTIAEMALIKMTDSSLDSSNDALLARIAKLEHALLVGGAPAKAVETSPVPKDRAQEPKPEAVKAPEKPEQKAQKPVETVEQKAKTVRGWSDIAESAAMGNNAVLPFLKMGKAFELADGSVSVKFTGDFAKTMVERAGINANIRVALAKALGRDIPEASFSLGIMTSEDKSVSDLDDLIV